MSGVNVFKQSIRPDSLDDFNIKQDFFDMMTFFDEDSDQFVNSIGQFGTLTAHWNIIKNGHSQINEIKAKIKYNQKSRETKLVTIERYLNREYHTFQRDFQIVTQKLQSTGFNPNDLTNLQPVHTILLTEYLNVVFGFLGFLQGMINVYFFGFESSMKIISSMGCDEFATKYATSRVRHNYVWRTLRKIGDHSVSSLCGTCTSKATCSFQINFTMLANCYAYIIKVRMISDYDNLFYSFAEISTGKLGQDLIHIFKYFTNITKIIKKQIARAAHVIYNANIYCNY